jgi:hypothetical protein
MARVSPLLSNGKFLIDTDNIKLYGQCTSINISIHKKTATPKSDTAIRVELPIFWGLIVSKIMSKNVYINMC